MLRLTGAAFFTLLLTAFMTWPQALHPATTLVLHHDTYFSIWRLAWVARALAVDPLHLFDANIFYPARGTLAYSDAMLLEGVLGAPLLWVGLSPTLTYNLLLFAGIAGSGLGMYVLARYLTGSTGAALVSAAAFTLAPYRIEHVMHLELQWTMWIPLALWATHRTIDTASWRFGALTGVFLWLQVISCVYYGVFLAMFLAIMAPLLLVAGPAQARRRAFVALALGAALAALLILPYALPYLRVSQTLGGRDLNEIGRYSARPINYLAATVFSWLWGWTADRWGDVEVRLFPGLIVVLLAVLSVVHRRRGWVLVYAAGAVVAFGISLGLNNPLYRLLFDHVALLQGLRATARAAILVSAALSVLAGFGVQALIERAPRRGAATLMAAIALMAMDGAIRPLNMYGRDALEPAPVYKVIRSAGPGVVLELPLPALNRLPGREAEYMLWSLQHWHPLINGYSGYYPPDYVRTLLRMAAFPDDQSIDWLRLHDVRYVVVHQQFYPPEEYAKVLFNIAQRPELRSWGRYDDAYGHAELFVLEPRAR